MRTLSIALVIVAITMLVLPASAAVPQQIAAQFDYAASGAAPYWEVFYNNYIVAQTFIPTISGTVASMDIPVDKRYSGYTGDIPISFEIRSVWNSGLNGMQPDRRAGVAPLSTGSVSASHPLLNDNIANWVNVQMTPYQLQAGQMYAIVASALGTNQNYFWYTKGNTSQYPSGNELLGYNGDTYLGNQYPYDLAFRVNVAVPEPGSLLALGSGLIGLVGFRFRRK